MKVCTAHEMNEDNVRAYSSIYLLNEFQELRLGSGRIAHQEHIHVAAQAHPVGKNFSAASHQLTGDRLLDVVGVLTYD
jgi:hypothetical protein